MNQVWITTTSLVSMGNKAVVSIFHKKYRGIDSSGIEPKASSRMSNHSTITKTKKKKSVQTSWSSGNALVSGAEELRFKSRVGQIGTKCFQRLATAATFLRKELCCL